MTYNALTVLDAVGRYPELWRGSGADPEDVLAVAQTAACLVAYNVDRSTGTVAPRSCYRGFDECSFGQKKRPSPFATACLLAALAPVADLAGQITAVDVTLLSSSKGGRESRCRRGRPARTARTRSRASGPTCYHPPMTTHRTDDSGRP